MGFVWYGWRFIFGKVRKWIEGTFLRSQKSSGALVESNKATSLRRKRKWVLSEDLLNWQSCRGHSVSPHINLTVGYGFGYYHRDFTFRGLAVMISDTYWYTAPIYIIKNENTLQLWDRRFRRNSSLQAVCDTHMKWLLWSRVRTGIQLLYEVRSFFRREKKSTTRATIEVYLFLAKMVSEWRGFLNTKILSSEGKKKMTGHFFFLHDFLSCT